MALRFIRDEISEKLEYLPARFVVNQYVRPQYGYPCCEKVFSGQMPAQLIPKGIAEASLVAQVVVSKYRGYQPLYRQQHIFARADVGLSVSTIAGWVGAAGVALTPQAKLLHRELLTCRVLHADETTMRILDTRKGGKNAYYHHVARHLTLMKIGCAEHHRTVFKLASLISFSQRGLHFSH